MSTKRTSSESGSEALEANKRAKLEAVEQPCSSCKKQFKVTELGKCLRAQEESDEEGHGEGILLCDGCLCVCSCDLGCCKLCPDTGTCAASGCSGVYCEHCSAGHCGVCDGYFCADHEMIDGSDVDRELRGETFCSWDCANEAAQMI